jgi:hypothetical protein
MYAFSVEPTAADADVEVDRVSTEFREGKTVVGRTALTTVQQLNEGMGLVPEKDTGDDSSGPLTSAVDKLEIPALEAGPAPADPVLEVKVLRPPNVH